MNGQFKRASNRFKNKARQLRNRYFDKFIFVHINKTGGSSIEKALALPFEHRTALELIDQIGRTKWDRKFTFSVVRNPWDKVVSHYHYRVQTNQTGLGDNPIGFRKWVKLSYRDRNDFYHNDEKMFMPQYKWITDEHGKLIVKKVLYFENLNEGFSEVCSELNLNIELPHVKASKRGNYRQYYDDETKEIIRQWFKTDLELFEFEY